MIQYQNDTGEGDGETGHVGYGMDGHRAGLNRRDYCFDRILSVGREFLVDYILAGRRRSSHRSGGRGRAVAGVEGRGVATES